MKPKTEELLYFLLWSANTLLRPTYRNLTDSFENWAYQNGFHRQLARLEKLQFVERAPRSSDDRLYRLTEHGRLQALGGRDPEAQWSRTWDGRWRMVLFDVPVKQNARREKLRRYLHSRAFGCLQGSVWITPDSMQDEREILAEGRVHVETLVFLEAKPAAGESDAEIVGGAWDFVRINHCYARHLNILERFPKGKLKDATAARALRSWAMDERNAWFMAMRADPLLPQRLLPPDYLGRRSWQRRKEVLQRAGALLREFASPQ